jgi:hypothetical protein
MHVNVQTRDPAYAGCLQQTRLCRVFLGVHLRPAGMPDSGNRQCILSLWHMWPTLTTRI